MAVVTSYWILDAILILFSLILYFYVNFKLRSRKYWAERNFEFEEPTFLFGNAKDVSYKISFQKWLDDMYFKHQGKKCIGMWMYVRPALLILDTELMKNIMIKDFACFHDRGITYNADVEPLTAHLFNMSGQTWRNLRVKLTPTFSSGKMKMMYETMYSVGLELQNHLQTIAIKAEPIEVKELLACFTTDVISSCAFGIQTKSFNDPDNDFRKHGRMLMNFSIENIIANVLALVKPSLQKVLKLRQGPKEVSEFFMKAVKDVVKYRRETKEKRKDFMELLVELINNGKIEDADSKYSEDTSKIDDGDPFTVELAAAQAFVFFFAGFETSSTTMMWTLYELALNPDIQDRLRKEIDEATDKDGGKLSYQSLQEMPYLEQVVQETLRKYPAAPVIFRECTKEYSVPDSDLVIGQGEFLMIPASAVQKDPKFFPDPERFDPGRFTSEAKEKRDSFLSLSFGAGPRICIGARFALLQIKVGLTLILSKFKVEVAEKTPIPVVFDPKMFFPTAKNGMPLKIRKR